MAAASIRLKFRLRFSPPFVSSLSVSVASPCSPLSLTLAFVCFLGCFFFSPHLLPHRLGVQTSLLAIPHAWMTMKRKPFFFPQLLPHSAWLCLQPLVEFSFTSAEVLKVTPVQLRARTFFIRAFFLLLPSRVTEGSSPTAWHLGKLQTNKHLCSYSLQKVTLIYRCPKTGWDHEVCAQRSLWPPGPWNPEPFWLHGDRANPCFSLSALHWDDGQTPCFSFSRSTHPFIWLTSQMQ